METRRLTIDMIKDYIRDNIKSFTNETIINTIQLNSKENSKQIKSKEIEKTLEKTLENYMEDEFNKIKINQTFFPDLLFSKDLIEHYIVNPLYKFKNEDDNINLKTLSFYYAVLYSLEDNFSSETNENKYKLYINLQSYLKKDIMIDGFKQHKYSKLKWNKNQIFKHFEKNTLDDKVIRYVSDALHVNIFYIKNNKVYYTGGEFIVFKKIVLLLNYNDRYYLICDNENKHYYFNNNEFIKSFLKNNENINLVFEEQFNPVGKEITVKTENNTIKNEKENKIEYNDDLNGYDLENTENKSVSDETESESESEDEEINESLSLIELQKKAKELKIDIFHNIDGVRKIKNKKQLCSEILKKKKS